VVIVEQIVDKRKKKNLKNSKNLKNLLILQGQKKLIT
jgi:hypothetical protein